MKITIEAIQKGSEDEIILRCSDPDSKIAAILKTLVSQDNTALNGLTAFNPDKGISILNPDDIFYFESVDDKVFAYCEKEVLELKTKLYELESRLSSRGFIRISKSMILNLSRAKSFNPSLGGRFEAVLSNGEKILISRQYVQELKKQLGV